MKLKFWAGIAVSLGLLIYLFSRIDLAKLWDAVRSVNPWYLALIVAANISFFAVRAMRWRYLMDPVKRAVPFGSLFSATMIGFMANNLLPARLGEFVRAYALGRREDVPKSSVFASIVVERLFDGLAVLLLLIVTLVFLPPRIAGGDAAVRVREAGMVSLALYVAAMGCLGFFLYRPHLLTRLVRGAVRPLSAGLAEKAAYMADSFMTGLGVVKKPGLLLLIVLYSAVHWGLMWIPTWLMFKAFGLDYGVYAAVFILVIMSFSVAVPSTPGYVGTFHAAATGGMVLLGMDPGAALGFAIVSHAISFIPVTLIGLYCLSRENLSLKAIRKTEAGQQA